jgi:hypothetical protein
VVHTDILTSYINIVSAPKHTDILTSYINIVSPPKIIEMKIIDKPKRSRENERKCT